MYFRGTPVPTSSQLPCNHLLSGSLRQLQCYTGKNQLVITPAFSAALFPVSRHGVPLLQPQVKCFGLTRAATPCSHCQGSQTRSLVLSPSPCMAAPELSLANVCHLKKVAPVTEKLFIRTKPSSFLSKAFPLAAGSAMTSALMATCLAGYGRSEGDCRNSST